MTQKPVRGEIYYIDESTTTGSEQRGGRPAVIVSNNLNNRHSKVVEVVYLTTSKKTELPTHVTIRSTPRLSTALCEQVHSVDVRRIGNYCTTCTTQELDTINTALLISLGLA